MATRCFWPPESRWGAWPAVFVHAHRRQGLVHPAADLLRAPPPGSPGQRPHPPPQWWPRSGYPGFGTPCPRCGGCPAVLSSSAVSMPVHIDLAAAGQQNRVEVLGQRGFAASRCGPAPPQSCPPQSADPPRPAPAGAHTFGAGIGEASSCWVSMMLFRHLMPLLSWRAGPSSGRWRRRAGPGRWRSPAGPAPRHSVWPPYLLASPGCPAGRPAPRGPGRWCRS